MTPVASTGTMFAQPALPPRLAAAAWAGTGGRTPETLPRPPAVIVLLGPDARTAAPARAATPEPDPAVPPAPAFDVASLVRGAPAPGDLAAPDRAAAPRPGEPGSLLDARA